MIAEGAGALAVAAALSAAHRGRAGRSSASSRAGTSTRSCSAGSSSASSPERRRAARALLVAPLGLRVLRRARRDAGAGRGRRGDRERAARGLGEPRRAVRDGSRGRGDPRAARSRTPPASSAARRPRSSFGMNMTTLNFALSRAAGRDFAPGDEILTTALDHDGGVAPWVELAADKGLTVRVVDATDDLTVDYDDLERQLSERTTRRRVRARLERDRLARRRAADLRARRARRARSRGSTPCTTRRTSRSTSRRSAATSCSARRTSSAARISASPTCAASSAETWRAVQGAAVRRRRPVGRTFETGTLPYELLAGFSATIAYLDSLGGMDVLRDYERELGEQFLDNLPQRVTPLRAAGDGGPRADVPPQRRGRPGRSRRPRARRARASASGTPTTGTASRSPTACPSSRSASG